MNPLDRDFIQYCRQASDDQLKEILIKEWNVHMHRDYPSALTAAIERGWHVECGVKCE